MKRVGLLRKDKLSEFSRLSHTDSSAVKYVFFFYQYTHLLPFLGEP